MNEFDVINMSKTKILIAEDNKSNQFLLKKILKDKYDFKFANNGQEAVDILKNENFHLILTVFTHAA
ncbi:MAG: hypothetical protein MK132_06850 [Lentisphaerales bacterium]|nr:hypothetical protein [Lentisphaerales bacterium]